MNTRGLARHYEGLTPWERLPLILAAFARGDEAERERLVASAPRVCYEFPDHFGLGTAFREVSEMHFMRLLHLAALYFRALGFADAWDDEPGERMLDAALLFGYLFRAQLGGWRAFCAELHIDPDVSWSCLPGFDTVKDAERSARHAAFEREGAEAYLRKRGGDRPALVTEADVAAGLRKALQERADWWG
jgi:hypothetical protein